MGRVRHHPHTACDARQRWQRDDVQGDDIAVRGVADPARVWTRRLLASSGGRKASGP
jgi:hypothetical protein